MAKEKVNHRHLVKGDKVKIIKPFEEWGNKFEKDDELEVVDTEPQACSTLCLNEKNCLGKVKFLVKGNRTPYDMTDSLCLERKSDELKIKKV